MLLRTQLGFLEHRQVTAHFGIRTRDHKLVFYYGQALGQTDYPATQPEWECFDLKRDPQEMRNVYAEPTYANTIKDLKRCLLAMKAHYQDTDDLYPEMKAVYDHYWHSK